MTTNSFDDTRRRLRMFTRELEPEPYRGTGVKGELARTRDIMVEGGETVEVGTVWKGVVSVEGEDCADYVSELSARPPITRWLLDTCLGPQVAYSQGLQEDGTPKLPTIYHAAGTLEADVILDHLNYVASRFIEAADAPL